MKLDYKTVKIEDCVMLKRNPQYMSEKQMQALQESIRRDGYLAPIVLRPRDGKYEILSGNHRWMAAKAVGLEAVPAVIGDFSEKQAQRIAINMNTVHGDPTPELMAPFLADMDDEILASCHFEKDFLSALVDFDADLHDKINSLSVPDAWNANSPTSPLPRKNKTCPHCGHALD